MKKLILILSILVALPACFAAVGTVEYKHDNNKHKNPNLTEPQKAS